MPERSRCRRRRNSVEERAEAPAKQRLRKVEAPRSEGSGEERSRCRSEAVPERSGAGAKQVPERAINFKRPQSGNRFLLPGEGGAARGTSGATGDERTAPRRDGSGEGTKPVPERSGAGSEEDGRTRKRTGRPVVSPLPSVREGRRPVSMASNLSAS